MSDFNIQFDSNAVGRFMDELPSTIKRAHYESISVATTWAKKELIRRMTQDTGFRERVFSGYRVKSKRNRGKGVAWLGYNEVKTGYAGKLTQESGGASVAGHYFPGGFVATMRSGHSGIFKRLGNITGRIIEQSIDIPEARQYLIVETLAQETQVVLYDKFASSIRQLNPYLN